MNSGGHLLVRYLRQILPVERLGEQPQDHVLREVRAREQDLVQPAAALVLLQEPGQLLGVDQSRPLGGLYEQVLHSSTDFHQGCSVHHCAFKHLRRIDRLGFDTRPILIRLELQLVFLEGLRFLSDNCVRSFIPWPAASSGRMISALTNT